MATVSFNHGSPSTVEVEVGNILGSVLEQLPMKINGPLHNYSTYVNLDFNDGKIKSGNSSPSLSKSVSWSVYGVPGP